ncbi:MAG: hypothetical protein ACYCQI_16585 [Gammaproteobacteria bacterium]
MTQSREISVSERLEEKEFVLSAQERSELIRQFEACFNPEAFEALQQRFNYYDRVVIQNALQILRRNTSLTVNERRRLFVAITFVAHRPYYNKIDKIIDRSKLLDGEAKLVYGDNSINDLNYLINLYIKDLGAETINVIFLELKKYEVYFNQIPSQERAQVFGHEFYRNNIQLFIDLNNKGYSISEKLTILNDEFYRNNMQFFVDLPYYSFSEKQTILNNKALRDFCKNHPDHVQIMKNCLCRHLLTFKSATLDDFISTIIKIYEKNLDKISELSISLNEKFVFLARNRELYNLSAVWKVVYDNHLITVMNLQGLQNLLDNDQKQHLDFLLKNIHKAHLLATIFKLLKDSYLEGMDTLYNKLYCAMEYIDEDKVRKLTQLSETRSLTKVTFLEILFEPKLLNRLFRPVKEKKLEITSPRPSGFPVLFGRLD